MRHNGVSMVEVTNAFIKEVNPDLGQRRLQLGGMRVVTFPTCINAKMQLFDVIQRLAVKDLIVMGTAGGIGHEELVGWRVGDTMRRGHVTTLSCLG